MPKKAQPLAGVSLLIADDHVDSAELLELVMTSKGAHVAIAHSAKQALALLQDLRPDALLLDISLPDSDGYALLRAIRALPGLADVPAIAVTGHASERHRAKAVEAGFAVHTIKPIDAEALVDLVATLVGPPQPAEPVTIAELDRMLSRQGLVHVLRTLNARTSYRYSALYRYEGATLRSVALVDRLDPDTVKGGDVPLETTFCGIVQRDRASFVTHDASTDARIVGLPLREDVRSYCGALVRHADGTPYGSLCHFDHEAREVPVEEIALLEDFAPRLARMVAVEIF